MLSITCVRWCIFQLICIDGQIGTQDCPAYQRACSYPDESVPLVLDGEDHCECPEYVPCHRQIDRANSKMLGIVQLFQHFQRGFEQSRICIKIPATWEGLMACRALESAGVHTLATTLFTMTQAALSAEVGCTYVAPYVNQLKVHFEPGLVSTA